MAELFSNPIFQLILGGIALAALVIFIVVKKRNAADSSGVGGRTKRLAASGNYEAAANRELKEGNLGAALEYFLRAQKPLRAAEVAKRMGQSRQAAELYEQAGDLHQAAEAYRAAGLDRKAEEIEQRMGARAGGGRSLAPAPEEGQLLSPAEQARQAAHEFEELHRRAEGGDAEALAQLEKVGRETSEALLTAGEIRRAAEICVDAGLHDQAINLFVNLLGEPGAAAPLFAERGDHQRAAELFEAAGKKERALAEWIDWSKEATDPLAHISQVERLGENKVFALLDSVVNARPASQDTIGLHFRIAEAYEQRERAAQAIAILERVAQIDPQFQNVGAKIQQLQLAVASPPPAVTVPPEEPPAVSLPPVEAPASDPPADEGKAFAKTMTLAEDEAERGATAAPAAASAETPATPAELEQIVDSPVIEQLVSEVAAVAAREATALAWQGPAAGGQLRQSQPPGGGGSSVRRVKQSAARGIERVEVTLQLVHDDLVAAARQGPSIDELSKLIGTQQADLQNIELFYRLGLSYAAAGKWIDARKAFDAVEEASPGYRDAAARAAEFERWQETMPVTVASKSMINDEQSQRYSLLGEIGRGGMAVVYRAKDEMLEREVALKFVTDEISDNPQMLKMFKREAQAAAALNHPNIVTVYDLGTLDGRAFISMEFVVGVTVEELIDEHEKLKVIEALRITENVLQALKYAHEKKFIHRDIKPSNMMRNELGVVKVMDFGLAKSTESQGKTTIIAGTPSYMPPEQFTGKGMDARSDIFAVGASLYEMLAGYPPFEGMDRSKEPEPIQQINPAVPKLLGRLIHRSIELDKEKRIQNADEMLKPIGMILSTVQDFMKKGG